MRGLRRSLTVAFTDVTTSRVKFFSLEVWRNVNTCYSTQTFPLSSTKVLQKISYNSQTNLLAENLSSVPSNCRQTQEQVVLLAFLYLQLDTVEPLRRFAFDRQFEFQNRKYVLRAAAGKRKRWLSSKNAEPEVAITERMKLPAQLLSLILQI